jgi:hypothetical protein
MDGSSFLVVPSQEVSIPRQSRGFIPPRGLIAIGQDQNRTVIAQFMASVFVAVIPAKAGIQCLLDSGSRFTCPE